MASCKRLKRSTMGGPLPDALDPTANRGEFALIDNGDDTLTLAIVNPAGVPSPIDPVAGVLTVKSDAPDVVGVLAPKGFTFGVRIPDAVERGKLAPPTGKPPTTKAAIKAADKAAEKAEVKAAAAHEKKHPTVTVDDYAVITATVTWTDGTAPHVLSWDAVVAADVNEELVIEHGEVTVSSP